MKFTAVVFLLAGLVASAAASPIDGTYCGTYVREFSCSPAHSEDREP
jgi:hypothetical protein